MFRKLFLVALALVLCLSVSALDVNHIGYYPGDLSANTTLYDLSGYSNDGLLGDSSQKTSSGCFDVNCLLIDDGAEFVNLYDSLAYETEGAIEFDLYPVAVDNYDRLIDYVTAADGIICYWYGSELLCNFKKDDASIGSVSIPSWTGSYKHLLLTWQDNNVVEFFVDGNLIDSASMTDALPWIDFYDDNLKFCHSGLACNVYLDEIKISNIKRTGNYDYNSGSGGDSNVVLRDLNDSFEDGVFLDGSPVQWYHAGTGFDDNYLVTSSRSKNGSYSLRLGGSSNPSKFYADINFTDGNQWCSWLMEDTATGADHSMSELWSDSAGDIVASIRGSYVDNKWRVLYNDGSYISMDGAGCGVIQSDKWYKLCLERIPDQSPSNRYNAEVYDENESLICYKYDYISKWHYTPDQVRIMSDEETGYTFIDDVTFGHEHVVPEVEYVYDVNVVQNGYCIDPSLMDFGYNQVTVDFNGDASVFDLNVALVNEMSGMVFNVGSTPYFKDSVVVDTNWVTLVNNVVPSGLEDVNVFVWATFNDFNVTFVSGFGDVLKFVSFES